MLSFAEAHAALYLDGDLVEGLKCIAVHERNRCSSDVASKHIENARSRLRIPLATLTCDDVRYIIKSLFCTVHRRRSTSANMIEEEWEREFPHLQSEYESRRNSKQSRGRKSGARGQRPSLSSLPSSSPRASPFPTPRERSRVSSEPSSPTPERNTRRPSTNGQDLPSTSNEMNFADVPEVVVHQEDGIAAAIGAYDSAHGRHESTNDNLNDDSASLEDDWCTDAAPMPGAFADEAQHDEIDYQLGEAEAQQRFGPDIYPYRPGKASTWAPCAIRSNVLRIFWTPLNEQRGSIYAVKVKNQPIVKIGWTKQHDAKSRLRQIQSQHGQELDLSYAFWKSNIPLVQLIRLEDLVKADLAYSQRSLPTASGIRYEYFQIDLAEAERTILFWTETMDRHGAEPGKQVDPKISASVQASVALAVDANGANSSMSEEEKRESINQNRDLWIKDWKNAFRQSRPGFTWQSQRLNSWAFIGGAVLLLLPDLFNHSSRLCYSVLCVSIVFWMQGQ